MTPPLFPAGPFADQPTPTLAERTELIAEVRTAPGHLRELVKNLSDVQLDVRYRDWTIRQIVHHLADSHVNSYIRFKWTLTEEKPTIKAYHEGNWAALDDSRQGAIAPALALFEGIHLRWALLLETMTDSQFQRVFHHPESGETINLNSALSYYAWHGKHHMAQIRWVRQQQGW